MGSTRAEGSSSLNKSQHGHAIFWVDGAQTVHTELKVNTGNKKGVYRAINDTYTMGKESGAYELECTVLDYKDGVLKRGDVLDASFNGKVDTTGYYVYGHPDKFEYDYSTKYNNSGLNSALNILAAAGKVDVYENNSHYSDYLSTPIGTKTTDTLETINIYPDSYKIAETEDQFLFDCIKNGFAISIKDPSVYKTVEDLVAEDGGGVKSLFESTEGDYPYQEGIETICKLLGKFDIAASAETLTIKGTKEVEDKDTTGSGTEGSETEGGTAATEQKSELYREKYDFCERLAQIVKQGKGCIVIGNGYNFEGDAGHGTASNTENIALNVVGVIEGPVETTDADGKTVYVNDICGFYVIENSSQQFLGSSDNAKFLTADKLYDFLVGFNLKEGDSDDVTIIVTDNEIKSWADNLNITGNAGRNYITGNDSNNVLKGESSSDVLYGKGGNDKLYGGTENDTLSGGSGDDYLDGGSGNDTYVFLKSDGVCHDTVVLGTGKDTIMFEDARDVRYEKDISGNLVLYYKNGTQTEESSVTIKDYFKKGLYNNLANICFKKDFSAYKSLTDIKTAPGELKNFLKEVLYGSDTVIVNQLNKDVANKATGSNFNDFIEGGYKDDTITSGSGNDTICGGAGNDVIKAGSGDDTIIVSTGNDKIYGEDGLNKIYYNSTLSEYGGSDTIYSGKGQDYIYVNNSENLTLNYAKSGNNLIINYSNTEVGQTNPHTGSLTITDYFKKNGNTSVKGIYYGTGEKPANYIQLNNSAVYQEILAKVTGTGVKIGNAKDNASQNLTGSVGNDTITGGKGNDKLNGGLGNDVIKAGNGNDTLIGGRGNDKLYGQGGDNTYVFNEYLSGQDIIYTSGNGKTTIDFSALDDVIFDASGLKNRAADMYEHTLTRSGKNLVLNYAADNTSIDESKITISNFFKAKGAFEIINGDGTKIDLRSMTLNIDGNLNKKNKITGTSMNDYIVGGNLNDTLKGGTGNDTLVGGNGNDNITGGAGNNTIIYSKGNGNDTINLTKGENLTIDMKGFSGLKDFSFAAVKNNLEISYRDKFNNIQKVTLKNFVKKDVTTASGSVTLKVGDKTLDLREGAYLPEYNNFTNKKTKYTGNWHSEVIDATSLDNYIIKNSKGANINAGAGNDTIYGSMYNDKIKGGEGDDVIHTNGGKNTIDGGNGSDKYYLFEGVTENTTIKDTGAAGTDIGIICGKGDLAHILSDYNSLYFNVNKSGSYNDIFVKGANGTVSMTGVEQLQIQDNDGNLYKFDIDSVKNDIVGYLNKSGYNDVASAINDGAPVMNDIYAAFTDANNWTQI